MCVRIHFHVPSRPFLPPVRPPVALTASIPTVAIIGPEFLDETGDDPSPAAHGTGWKAFGQVIEE
ncbi:MAG: hypothetical protein M3380_01915 [Chloroflexota bacterium]|nr:hypothetical protein [Chloroflexota bacterium]